MKRFIYLISIILMLLLFSCTNQNMGKIDTSVETTTTTEETTTTTETSISNRNYSIRNHFLVANNNNVYYGTDEDSFEIVIENSRYNYINTSHYSTGFYGYNLDEMYLVKNGYVLKTDILDRIYIDTKTNETHILERKHYIFTDGNQTFFEFNGNSEILSQIDLDKPIRLYSDDFNHVIVNHYYYNQLTNTTTELPEGYYTNIQTDINKILGYNSYQSKIYIIDINDLENPQIITNAYRVFPIHNNYYIYTNPEQLNELYLYNLNSLETQKVVNNFYGEWLYYNTAYLEDNNQIIYKVADKTFAVYDIYHEQELYRFNDVEKVIPVPYIDDSFVLFGENKVIWYQANKIPVEQTIDINCNLTDNLPIITNEMLFYPSIGNTKNLIIYKDTGLYEPQISIFNEEKPNLAYVMDHDAVFVSFGNKNYILTLDGIEYLDWMEEIINQ